MMKYPETIQELEEELLRHSKDGRSDILFRFVIMHAQLGDLAAYLSHDQVLNPTARPYGANVEEMNAVGHYSAIKELETRKLKRLSEIVSINNSIEFLKSKSEEGKKP